MIWINDEAIFWRQTTKLRLYSFCHICHSDGIDFTENGWGIPLYKSEQNANNASLADNLVKDASQVVKKVNEGATRIIRTYQTFTQVAQSMSKAGELARVIAARPMAAIVLWSINGSTPFFESAWTAV